MPTLLPLDGIAEHHDEVEGETNEFNGDFVDVDLKNPSIRSRNSSGNLPHASSFDEISSESSDFQPGEGFSPARFPPRTYRRLSSDHIGRSIDPSYSPARPLPGSVTPGRPNALKSSSFSVRSSQKEGSPSSIALPSPSRIGASRDAFETTLELMRLRESNAFYQDEIARLKQKIENLEADKRRMSVQMSAMQRSLQKVQQEADARNHTCTGAAVNSMTGLMEVMGHMMSLHSSRQSLEGPNFSMWTRSEIEADHASAISTIAKLVEENTRLVGKINKLQTITSTSQALATVSPTRGRSVPDFQAAQAKRSLFKKSVPGQGIAGAEAALAAVTGGSLTSSALRSNAVQKLLQRQAKSPPTGRQAGATMTTTTTTTTTTTVTATQTVGAAAERPAVAQSAKMMVALAETSTHVV